MTQNAWNSPNLTTNGQLLIGQGSGRPTAATLTEGTGITITNGAGSISIAGDGGSTDFDYISTSTASTSASITFTGLSSTYQIYVVEISDLQADTNNTFFWMRTSTDNGSSYDSGASDYKWNLFNYHSGSPDSSGSTADTKYLVVGASGEEMGNNTNETVAMTVKIYNPSDTIWTKIYCQGNYMDDTGDHNVFSSEGMRADTTAVNAIQFLMASGNILTGTFRLYGLKP